MFTFRKLFSGLLLSIVTVLTSCETSSFDASKITLSYKIKGLTAPISLTDEARLVTLLNNEASNNLLLASYALEHCTCWYTFKVDVLTPFVKKTEIPVYVIHTNLLTNFYGLEINESQTNTPVFGIYENGVYKSGATYFNQENIFTSESSFTSYVKSYINYPTNYLVS